MSNTSPSPAGLLLTAKRWDAKPWEPQELVVYKARVERETEKAVLLVDLNSRSRRSVWMPKAALKGDKHGTLSPWACGKLDAAGFAENDVFSV